MSNQAQPQLVYQQNYEQNMPQYVVSQPIYAIAQPQYPQGQPIYTNTLPQPRPPTNEQNINSNSKHNDEDKGCLSSCMSCLCCALCLSCLCRGGHGHHHHPPPHRGHHHHHGPRFHRH